MGSGYFMSSAIVLYLSLCLYWTTKVADCTQLLTIFSLQKSAPPSTTAATTSPSTSSNGIGVSSVTSIANAVNHNRPLISLPAVRVDSTGKVYTVQVLKQQLANELGLPLRDLRIIDPSFPTQVKSSFVARKKAALFSLENIKVVVRSDEALVFSPFQKEAQDFIQYLQKDIQNGDESKEKDNLINPSSRFELAVIEAALAIGCNSLTQKVRALSPAIASALNGLRSESRGLEVVQTQVDELLPLKNKLDELRKRVKEFRRAINDVLNNDEDMDLIIALPTTVENADESDGAFYSENSNRANEGGNRRAEMKSVDHMDLEMLLENYLNEVEWISAEIEEIEAEVTNTEENVVLLLDMLRNRILRFELLLSVASFCVGIGALVTGLFGMNLLSHLEMQRNTFYIVTGMLSVGIVGAFTAIMRYARKEKLF